MFSFFTGRSNRQEYWISVVLLIVVAVALTFFQMEAASAAITVMWVITWMRRLHDIGRPGWLALVPLVLVVVVVLAGFALGGDPLMKALVAVQSMKADYVMPDKVAYLLFGMVLAAIVIQFGFTIWLGAKKSDAGENRFGPPAPDIFKRS